MQRRKILVMGDSKVGKSHLVSSFKHPSADYSRVKYNPTIEDNHLAEITLSAGSSIIHDIRDMGGVEYKNLVPHALMEDHGIMLVYDVTNQESFEHITTTWMKVIRESAPKGTPIVLVGNKCDKKEDRVITTEVGRELAEKLRQEGFKISFIETSTVIGHRQGVVKAFQILADEIAKSPPRSEQKRQEPERSLVGTLVYYVTLPFRMLGVAMRGVMTGFSAVYSYFSSETPIGEPPTGGPPTEKPQTPVVRAPSAESTGETIGPGLGLVPGQEQGRPQESPQVVGQEQKQGPQEQGRPKEEPKTKTDTRQPPRSSSSPMG